MRTEPAAPGFSHPVVSESTRITLHSFLRARRSIRRFKPTTIDPSIITRIIETATYAPSAHNRQPWRFAILTQPETKALLSDSLTTAFRTDLAADGLPENDITALLDRSKSRINQAPVVIILCMDVSEMDFYPDEKRSSAERVMAIQSVAAAGLQMQLAAQAEGLSSVWTCSPLFSPDSVRSALDLPSNWEPQAMYFMGYSDFLPKEKPLKPIHEIVKFF
jgi:F420 biosynthesis protein FbiB-like protein